MAHITLEIRNIKIDDVETLKIDPRVKSQLSTNRPVRLSYISENIFYMKNLLRVSNYTKVRFGSPKLEAILGGQAVTKNCHIPNNLNLFLCVEWLNFRMKFLCG